MVAAGALDSAATVALWQVGDKPLLEYPLAMLSAAGIRRILIVAAAADAARIQRVFGGGERCGVDLSYLIGPASPGLAAVAAAGEFVGRRAVAVAAAERVIFGHGLAAQLNAAAQRKNGACVFACAADSAPADSAPPPGLAPGQQHAGLFFYDKTAPARAADLVRESPAAGLDDLHRAYQNAGKLRVEELAPAVKCLRVADADSLRAVDRALAGGDSP